jgi:Tfp pilus assembly protein PilO
MNRMTMGRSLLLGAMVGAFYYFIFLDQGQTQQNNIVAAQQQIADLQKQIKENQAKLDRAAVYKKIASEVGTTINKLLGVIPEKFAIPDLMKIVSNEAKIAGTSLNNITPGTPEISNVAREFEEFTVSLDMNGSFLQHMIFLSNLTKINQILIIRKFDMSLKQEAKGEESPVVKLVAEIVAYRYRGAAAIEAERKAKSGAK